MAITGVHRRTIVALISIATAISCVSTYLQLSFIVFHVNSIVSEANLLSATVPDQLPSEIQRLKEEASTSQAIEIEKTRQEVSGPHLLDSALPKMGTWKPTVTNVTLSSL
jgi:hypothetical protein